MMEALGCTETSVRNYHYSLRNNPEEGSSQRTFCLLHQGPVALQPLGLLYALFSRRSHCRRQMSPRPTRRERSKRREGELQWATKSSREFWLNADFHVTLRDLLHAVNLRHGAAGFTAPPKEGVLGIFSPWKIRRLRPGLNPRTRVLEASTHPLNHRSRSLKKLSCLKSASVVKIDAGRAPLLVWTQIKFHSHVCRETLRHSDSKERLG
jgi:hypothetical protein